MHILFTHVNKQNVYYNYITKTKALDTYLLLQVYDRKVTLAFVSLFGRLI